MRFLTVALLALCAFGSAVAVDDGVPPIPIIVGLGPVLSGGGTIDANTLEGKTWESPGTIGSSTPNTGAFTTLTVGSSKFSVDANGNIIKLNNVATSFPAVQGTAGQFLSNDGAGNLTWMSGAVTNNNFDALTSGTNTTAAMVVGTGASLGTSGSGTIAATSAATAAAAPFSGLTASTNSTAAMVVGTGASLATSGSGTIAATSTPYSGLTSGTNTTGALVIGTGASLATSGSGTIAATTSTTATTAAAVPFSGVSSSTNTTGALVVGTGGSLGTSGSGTINATALNGATFAAPGTIGGGTPAAATFTAVTDNTLTTDAFLYSGTGGLLTTAGAPTDGQLLIGSTGAAPVRASLTAGSNVTITPGAGTITIAAAGSATPAFSAITSGTNTGAAMVVGTGASLTVSGSGTNNATTLNGATFAAPGAIGGGTPGSVAATTISATGQITSTLATGTAPLVVASTTNVANLNASSLSGATFAAPGPIGSGTPGTGAFTTLSAGSGKFTVDANGNVTKLNNVTQSWPAANAAGGLQNDGAGNLSWTSTPAITLPWSSLTAPTGNLSLAMGANTTAMTYNTATTGTQWDMSSSSLTTGKLINLASTSTAAASNTQTVLGVATSGANSNSAQVTYGADLANTHTGSSSTNIGLRTAASGGTSNYGLIVSAGDVGVGTSTPVATLEDAGAGAASKPGLLTSGAWFTGGSATTTKPHVLIEPTGTVSTAWATAGTGLGINAAATTGDLINAQAAGVVKFSVSANGKASIQTTNQFYALAIDSSTAFTVPFGSDAGSAICITNTNATLNNWTGISFGGTSGTGANAVQAGIYSQISNHSAGTRANNLVFYTATAGAATERMQISNTGLVGIGTVGLAVAGVEDKINSAVSRPSMLLSGTVFSGGSATTTKPQLLIEPSGTTSTGWSTSGTLAGINAAGAFVGNLSDMQVAGVSKFNVDYTGASTTTNTANINGAAGTQRALVYQTAGSTRWNVRAGNAAESGGNAGSSYIVQSFDDTGVAIDFPLVILRPAGGTMTTVRPWIDSYTGIASVPAGSWTGSWFTGGSATTTKPQLLIEPAATASTAWSTSGTGIGANATSGFAGNLIDLQVAASSKFKVASNGDTTVGGKLTVVGGIDPTFLELNGTTSNTYLNMTSGSADPVSAANQGRIRYNSGTQQFEASSNGAAYAALGGGGAPAFSSITSGTNTGAAMVVGSGASMAFTGTGILTAPRAGDPTTCFFAGTGAGAAVTSSGIDSVAIGLNAAGTATIPSSCIAIGTNAYGTGGNASDVIAIGNGAVLKGGNKNLGIGTNALGGASLAGAIENIALGYTTGTAITSGNYSTMLGSRAGVNLTTGSADILLGANAGFGLANSASNTLVIGDTNVHATNYAINTVTIMSSATGGPTWTNSNIFSSAGAASAPAAKYSGAWFTGGSATTTKPQLLVEASGATSTGWNTAGTGIGGNAASGFTGNLLDLQLNGVSKFSVSSTGTVTGIVPWDQLSGPSGNVVIPMISHTTDITYDSCTDASPFTISTNAWTGGNLVSVINTGNAGGTNFYVSNEGTNVSTNTTTYAATIKNVRVASGTSGHNFALNLIASGGSGTNTALSLQTGRFSMSCTSNLPVASFENHCNASASLPIQLVSGSWFSGGSATTTKPTLIIEPSGTTSTAWSTSGTGLGLNAASGFAGNLIDAQVSAATKFTVSSGGAITAAGTHAFSTVGTGNVYKSGTGAYAGNATLVGGTVTVTCATIGTNSVVSLTRKTSGGTIGTAITYTISNGASFTINSDNILDTSTFSYVVSDTN